MIKQEFIEKEGQRLWSLANSSEKIKGDLSKLGIEDFATLVEAGMSGKIASLQHPYLEQFWKENREYLTNCHQPKDLRNRFSVQISFDGRNIVGLEAPVDLGFNPLAAVNYIASSFDYWNNPGFWTAAADKENEHHQDAKKNLLYLCSMPSYSQLYARLNLTARCLGEELVNDALRACDCLLLEELKEMAEADDFQTQDLA